MLEIALCISQAGCRYSRDCRSYFLYAPAAAPTGSSLWRRCMRLPGGCCCSSPARCRPSPTPSRSLTLRRCVLPLLLSPLHLTLEVARLLHLASALGLLARDLAPRMHATALRRHSSGSLEPGLPEQASVRCGPAVHAPGHLQPARHAGRRQGRGHHEPAGHARRPVRALRQQLLQRAHPDRRQRAGLRAHAHASAQRGVRQQHDHARRCAFSAAGKSVLCIMSVLVPGRHTGCILTI